MRFYGLGMAAVVLAASAAVHGATAQPVAVTGFNYDVVATQYEVDTWSGPTHMTVPLRNAIGDSHTFSYQVDYAFASDADVKARYGASAVGLTPTISKTTGGHTWNYNLGTFDVGVYDGTTVGTGSNALRVSATDATAGVVATGTLTLATPGKFDSVNFLFQTAKSSGTSTNNMMSKITANYADGSVDILVRTKPTGWSANQLVGGTFGSAGNPYYEEGGAGSGIWKGGGGYKFTVDTDTTVTPALTMTHAYMGTGSGTTRQYDILSYPISIWTFTNGITVDPSRTLQSITFTLDTDRANYQNEVYVLGMAAVPEPATAGLVSLALVGLSLRRNRNR